MQMLAVAAILVLFLGTVHSGEDRATATNASSSASSSNSASSSSDCPKGAARYNRTRSCFWVIEQRLRWADADRACGKLGGKLASIQDEYENAFAFELARRVNLSVPTVWLGRLARLAPSGAYEWHDGAIGRQSDGFKEPPSGSDVCLTMWMDFEKPEGSWHEWDCNYAVGYSALCKKPWRRVEVRKNATSSAAPSEASSPSASSDVHSSRRCTLISTPGYNRCSARERCVPDDLNCLLKTCAGGGVGWCLPNPSGN